VTVLQQHSINSTRLIVTQMLPKESHLVSKRQVHVREATAPRRESDTQQWHDGCSASWP